MYEHDSIYKDSAITIQLNGVQRLEPLILAIKKLYKYNRNFVVFISELTSVPNYHFTTYVTNYRQFFYLMK